MLLYFTSRIISATAAFLYPGYASYKTLSQRPASEADLERWLMPARPRLPFYYPAKTIFLVYLALPQTAGAAYIYQSHLRPFFAAHETQIDSALAQLKAHVYASLQRLLRAAWEHVSATLRQMQGSGGAAGLVAGEAPLEEDVAAHTGAPPSLGDPISGPVQLAQGLWGAYGPSLLASGAALLRQAQTSAAHAQAQAQAQVSPGPGRRRQQEVPDVAPYDVSAGPSVPIPPANNPSRESSSSESSMRERSGSGNGKSTFEEVEVPSDMEGEAAGRVEPQRPAQTKRTSWFGWGASANPGKDYERVKTE
ncbi:HVA22-like protein j [Grifola frondosa]|uniref:Protein YOP1 n=1 Tax=Grifola frondosa TaxID=5627 RepID=A0A1C7MJ85_GRIFR|nr:HVA22-like protein j [Grifola frondosa]